MPASPGTTSAPTADRPWLQETPCLAASSQHGQAQAIPLGERPAPARGAPLACLEASWGPYSPTMSSLINPALTPAAPLAPVLLPLLPPLPPPPPVWLLPPAAQPHSLQGHSDLPPPPGLALALSSLLVLFSDAARALWLPLLLHLGHLCLPHPPVMLLTVLTRSLPSAAPTSLTQAHQEARILGWSSCMSGQARPRPSAARLLSPVALGPWPQF